MSAFSNIVACVKNLYLYICCFGDELVCLSHNKFLFCSVLLNDQRVKTTQHVHRLCFNLTDCSAGISHVLLLYTCIEVSKGV